MNLPDGFIGANLQVHFDQLKLFFEPIVNLVRINGANNILWIPGSRWQSQYKGYAVNSIVGKILVMQYLFIQDIGEKIIMILLYLEQGGMKTLNLLQMLL